MGLDSGGSGPEDMIVGGFSRNGRQEWGETRVEVCHQRCLWE